MGRKTAAPAEAKILVPLTPIRPAVARIGSSVYLVERLGDDQLRFTKEQDSDDQCAVHHVRRWRAGRYSCSCDGAKYGKGKPCRHARCAAKILGEE